MSQDAWRAVRPAHRVELDELPLSVAPRLLGAVLEVSAPDGDVAVRITEVEAYHGVGTGFVPDPGSHARSGRTARNATMWGEPGHLYVYLSHGIHSCVNVVCGARGIAGGVLLRAGAVVAGADIAERRRGGAGDAARRIAARDLARGPGRLGRAIGLHHPEHDGIDAIVPAAAAWPPPRSQARARLLMPIEPPPAIASGPRVGVAGVAGTDAFPWRFWIVDDPSVSPFRWGRGARELASERAAAARVLD